MRALCGAIIAAGAMFGLGLLSIGMGTRYAGRANFDGDGNPLWVKFSQMDTPLIYLTVLLTIVLLIGLGVAFFGLAYHHHRRWHEHQRLVEEHEHHRSTRRGAAKA